MPLTPKEHIEAAEKYLIEAYAFTDFKGTSTWVANEGYALAVNALCNLAQTHLNLADVLARASGET